MSPSDLSARLEDNVKILESARDFRGPFVLEINGIKTIVSRAQFLEFYIDVAIEELWGLKETVEVS
ncbi:hypothetical protein P4H46_21205 [Paenibacillus glucanolyticus]|uniref:hypothetical protein n=1 Tax=Paenibacillus glucanolyticus TaxID=59843 RepID=UPI0030C9C2CA